MSGGFELSQTFKQTANKISGASVYLGNYWGDGQVTMSIYSTDPYTDGGANPVAGATGSVYGTHGSWADVFWSPVSITAGQTYYLNFQGSNTVIDYTTGDTYTNGDAYYYGGPISQGNYDYSFKTWAPVPAPGSAALLGLGGLAASRRRRA